MSNSVPCDDADPPPRPSERVARNADEESLPWRSAIQTAIIGGLAAASFGIARAIAFRDRQPHLYKSTGLFDGALERSALLLAIRFTVAAEPQ